MAATEEMLEIALDSKPERVCIVPEKRLEVTTEGGLDLLNMNNKKESFIFDIIKQCKNTNIDVSLFIDPGEAIFMGLESVIKKMRHILDTSQ